MSIMSGRSPSRGNKKNYVSARSAEIFGREEKTKAKKYDQREAPEKFFGKDFPCGYC